MNDPGENVADAEPTAGGRRVVRRPAVLAGRDRPRVRRVTRVVRSVDPWSVFKVSLVFSLVTYLAVLLAVVLLWNVAHSTGTVDNVERFLESFGWESFTFDGPALFRALWVAGLFVAVGFTGLMVLAATIFNLITDLVGGIHCTVLEEEVVVRSRDASDSTPRPAAQAPAMRAPEPPLEPETTPGRLSPLEAALQPLPPDLATREIDVVDSGRTPQVSAIDADLTTAAVPIVEDPPNSVAKPVWPPRSRG